MDYRKRNVSFNKAGGTASRKSYSPKITIPRKWLTAMNVTPDETALDVFFDGEQIIIKKTQGSETNETIK